MTTTEIQKFKQHLRNEGAATQFYNNTRMFCRQVELTNVENYLKMVSSEYVFVIAFGWAKTKEGPDYWADLCNKWRLQC